MYLLAQIHSERSILKQTNDSITDFNEFDKRLDDYLEEMQKEFLQQLDPSHLKTVSMSEFYNTVYQSKPPLIDGLLYPGIYLCRSTEAWQEFLYGSACLPYQHRHTALEF